jgi:hypothetical protein
MCAKCCMARESWRVPLRPSVRRGVLHWSRAEYSVIEWSGGQGCGVVWVWRESGVAWCGVVGLKCSLGSHPLHVSSGVGSAHHHGQALEQGSVTLTGWPGISVGSLAGQLLQDGAGLWRPCSAGFTNHG